MLEYRSFSKIGLQKLNLLTQLRHTTLLSTAIRNIFINREIYYIISVTHLDIFLLNLIQLYHYLELSLVTWEIYTNVNFLPANLISLFPFKHIIVKSLFKTINNPITILVFRIEILLQLSLWDLVSRGQPEL